MDQSQKDAMETELYATIKELAKGYDIDSPSEVASLVADYAATLRSIIDRHLA